MLINGKEFDIKPGVDLRGANLRGADLYCVDLEGACLEGACLEGANLQGANLHGADLRGSDLRGADLHSADLRGADLTDADLTKADLTCAIGISEAFCARSVIVGEGDLIGYKKLCDGTICKLKIPAAAKRSNATDRKCRAEYAIVLEGEGASKFDRDFHYRVGETVRPVFKFNEDRWDECASGIHFFLTRAEAEDY